MTAKRLTRAPVYSVLVALVERGSLFGVPPDGSQSVGEDWGLI